MPTTIAQGFAKLQENLQITDLQEATVDTRQKNVREAVAKELKVLDSFVTGSYRRGTLIAPLSKADIDIFVILDPSYYAADGYANIIDRVKRVLKQTYPTTPEISRNGQAVTITFTDFKVDVVPAFYRQGGGYLIPDSVMKRWISTDPTQHVTIWNTANTVHQFQLVPVMRMAKQWNRAHSALLRSFHLETITLQVLNNVKISDLPSAARFVFDKARDACKHVVNDPAGYGGDIGAYLDTS
jgi:predicted nucleotidyltransferase